MGRFLQCLCQRFAVGRRGVGFAIYQLFFLLGIDQSFVVGVFFANVAHVVAKVAPPVLANRPLDVGNNDTDDNFLAQLHSISGGFLGLGMKKLDIHYYLDAKVEFGRTQTNIKFAHVGRGQAFGSLNTSRIKACSVYSSNVLKYC
jgi:hypothetical protein